MIEGQEDVSWEQWLALAGACEHGGWHGLFRSDHYLPTIGGRERGSLDAWATLAALAARTERIRLGTLVSPVTFRHPSELAKSVTTVDLVSRGRVELGLGAGWNEGEHLAYGFRFPPLAERMELLEEQLEIVTRQWTEESVVFEGRHYRLEGCPALPKPVQRPRPRIVVGGLAGPRGAALAARFADEYNTFECAFDELPARRERIERACERLGRDPATLGFSLMAGCVVGADREDLLERARLVLRAIGAEDADPAEVLEARSDSWIAGTVDEVVARLRALEADGVDRVYLQHLAHDDLEMVELVGAEVAPALAS
jgi:F420-dependent oxidoreductase-like protein